MALVGKALIAQGGGPTAVINQSLVGVIQEARKHACITKIYGAVKGVEGIVNEDFLDLIAELSAQDFPYVGFTDYFYCVRSMFLPLLYLLGSDIPEADIYYSVSAGYAGVLGSMAQLRTGKPFLLTEHGIYTREREEEILRTNWVPRTSKTCGSRCFICTPAAPISTPAG